MSDPLRRKVTWFRNNLNLLIEDIELEKEKLSVDLYFDTLEVTHMVMGVQSFFQVGTFDVKGVFEAPAERPLRDRTLVLSLAFSGRLGPIKLLPPHQAEFLASLNKDFGVLITLPPKQLVRQFLESVSQSESIKREASVLKEADHRKTLEYVREHAGSATNFFKILQLLRGVTWQERLVKLRSTKTLRLPSHDEYYRTIVKSDLFQTLYRAFDNLRQNRLTANFADAVALTMLAKQVEQISKGDAKSVPRFYVTAEKPEDTPLFLEILERTALKDAFSYRLSGGTSDVLRRSDYFVFKSTFQKPTDSKDLTDLTRPKQLLKLRDDLSSILAAPSFIKPEQLDKIEFEGKKLNQVIDDLNTFLFFTNVWSPSSKQEVELVVGDLEEVADELRSNSLKRGVTEGIQAAKRVLQQNVIEYQLIRRMWVGVENATKFLSQQGIPEDVEFARDFGLLRFAFPDSAYDEINKVLEDLLKGSDAEGRLTHSNLIAACYLAHHSPQSNDKYSDNLAAAASVLWVAEMYREIVDLLSGVDPLPHYSLELIYAAALAEVRQKDAKLRGKLEKLYRRYSRSSNSRDKANLAVGLAYVYFHLWRLSHGPSWDVETTVPRQPQGGTDLIKRAISLALSAYKLLGDWDMKKKVYALNQYVYYLIMGADKNSFSSMHDAVNDLLKYKEEGDKDWWQHRFDDTLARYYFRLAYSASNAADWNLNMDNALRYADEAFRRAPWDKIARTFRDRLRNRKEKGFTKREQVA